VIRLYFLRRFQKFLDLIWVGSRRPKLQKTKIGVLRFLKILLQKAKKCKRPKMQKAKDSRWPKKRKAKDDLEIFTKREKCQKS
jgi:hypothetical protein